MLVAQGVAEALRMLRMLETAMTALAETLRLVAQNIATVVEGIGVLIVAVAVALAARFASWLRSSGLVEGRRRRTLPSDSVRLALGRSLALALEFLLGADILRTAVEPGRGMRSGAWPPSPPSAPRSIISCSAKSQPKLA